MDALKIMTEGMLKEERTSTSVMLLRFTLKSVRAREKESRFSKAQSLLARAAVFRRPSQSAVFLTA